MTDTSDKALLALADRVEKMQGRSHWDAAAAAAFRAIVAGRQAGVQVKPLVWSDEGNDQFIAQTVIGWYHVGLSNGRWAMMGPNIGDTRLSSLNDAKAAAQADYEARIRAALKGPNDDQ